MLDKIQRWITANHLLQAGDTILIACSGGADSVALVNVMNNLRQKYSVSLAVAHVNHLIRGQEGAEDAEFVANLCLAYELPIFSTEVDAPAYAREHGYSLEEAARILRYRFLSETAASLGKAKIATAHHQDDQAETILLNLLRGAGGAGLQGMRPRAGAIIRPFLDISRAEIEAYCRENHLCYRTDSSNNCVEYTRNRIRLQLLPFLEREFNPNIRGTLLQTATILADEHGYVAEAAAKAWHALASPADGGWLLDLDRMRGLHPAVRREVIRVTFEKITGSLKGITFRHVEILDRMCQTKGSECSVNLPGGLTACRSYTHLVIRRSLSERSLPALSPDVELPLPGRIRLSDGRVIVAEFLDSSAVPASNRRTAVFAFGALALPLTVGPRRPGDRFRPSGFMGTKKLKDFLIDSKVPRSERDRIPVVRDARGIIWVGGLRQAERNGPVGQVNQFIKLTILDPQEGA